jgi:hypothetical protein
MSWHFSRELVEEYLAGNSSDGEPSAPSNTTATPPLYSASDRMTDFCRRSRSGMMCGPLTADLGEALLTWFLAGFPVKTSVQPERAEESTTANAPASGWKWPGSSVRYDPASVSWKTRQCSLLGDSEEFSGAWPRWGTMRNGECWERQTWERRTSGKESGLWATPAATDGTRGGTITPNMTGQSLPQMVNTPAMWPTPKASAAGPDFAKMDRSGTGISLATAVAMFPTPTATNTKAVHMRGADKGKARQARSYLPTPTVNDAKNSTLPPSQVEHDNLPGYPLREGEKNGGQLNPTWVEWLMGWPLGWTDCAASAMGKSHIVPLSRGQGL